MAHTYIAHTKSGHPLMDTGLAIAMHAVPGITGMNKFGTNELVDQDFSYLWEFGDGWVALPSATTLEAASTSALDTALGTGATGLTIEGLDDNYDEISEDVALDGQTPVLTTQLFLYVNRVFITGAGSTEKNQGDIYVADDSTAWSSGVPVTDAAVQCLIRPLHGQSQQCIYTVPRGFTAFIHDGYMTTEGTLVTRLRVMFWNRFTNAHRTAFEMTIKGPTFSHTPYPPVAMLEKNSVYMETSVSAGSAHVSGGLNFVLVDNKMLGDEFDFPPS